MSSRHSLSNPVTMPMISSAIFFIQAKVGDALVIKHTHTRIDFQCLESSSPYDRVRDSGYETTSSTTERQRFLAPSSPSNVSLSPDGQFITVTYFSTSIPSSHPDTSLSSSFSSSNTIPRTLSTFSQMPSNNATGNDSSSMMINPRLAEQEIIEV